MFCCVNCFSLSEPKETIRDTGGTGACDFCGSVSVRTCETCDLTELFHLLLEHYEVREFQLHYLDPDAEITGETLAYLLQDDWGLFNDDLLSSEKMGELLQDILPSINVRDAWLTVRDRWHAEPEAERTQWRLFAKHIREERRFIPDVGNPELEAVINKLPVFLEQATETIPSGRIFYRSRLGYTQDRRGTPRPFPSSKMGAPPPDPGRGGRANPPGISYLYAASDAETAVSEKGPARGTVLSLARLGAVRDLTVVDLANLPGLAHPFVDSLSYELDMRDFLCALGHELSRPVSTEDPPLEYLPSQYLCEVILAHEYDGVVYSSGYSTGSNIVLFDPASVKISRVVKLVRVEEISTNLEYGLESDYLEEENR